MKPIPPLDLGRQHQPLQAELNQAVQAVLDSGQYIGGPAVAQFESDFAEYHRSDHCISCNSGTDALYLALRALKIGPGDEVITTPFTFIATAEVISMVGATPVFVDIDPQTFNISPVAVQAAITDRTRAILPVHLFGCPADMTALMAIAQDHQLFVIEDCAQATGGTWQGEALGTLGHVGCFSFYPSKNLGGCGDGGAILTQDADLASTLRLLRDHGRRSGYLHEAVGMNSRLDSLQAAVLRVKLPHLQDWNQQRQQVAQHYHELLSGIPGISLPQPPHRPNCVWNQYTLRIHHDGPLNAPHPRRDRIRAGLQEHQIQTMVYYPLPLHRQPVYASLNYGLGSLPQAEQAALEVLSLPMFPGLMPSEQEYIRDCLKDVLLTC